ncbi:MAG: NAAT family transporter [Spirochaetaceae bacterium]|nr:MAG: NAAT family transporter [Spirochaetaceae bacterium]
MVGMTSQLFTLFLTVLILVDPLGLVPVFLSLTQGMDARHRRKTMFKSVLVALFILTIFIVAGEGILIFLGILPGSFYIAGGILFFIISLDLLLGHPQRTKTSRREKDHRDDPSVFPLAVPILAGPGTITTIIIYSVETPDTYLTGVLLFLSVAASLGICLITMAASDHILRLLRETGVSVLQRLMGLILSALAVQFIYDGLVRLNIVA